MTGPVPKKIKPHITKSPEEVAAHESMRTNHMYPKTAPKGPRLPGRNAKTIKHTKEDNGIAKKDNSKKEIAEFDVYTEMGSWREKPVSDKWLDKLSLELLEWAEKKKSLKINSFLRLKKIYPKDFSRWRKRSKNLARAYECAILALGDNREIGAILKEYDKGMILPIMHRYDPEWKKSDEWRAEINTQKQNINQGIQVVEIPAAEKTDIVKPLPKDEDE